MGNILHPDLLIVKAEMCDDAALKPGISSSRRRKLRRSAKMLRAQYKRVFREAMRRIRNIPDTDLLVSEEFEDENGNIQVVYGTRDDMGY